MPSGLKLLVIEDNRSIAEAITHYATAWKMASTTAENIQTALGLMKQQAQSDAPGIDAIIIDFKLADDKGLEFIRKIKAEPGLKAIPMLMLTPAHHLTKAAEHKNIGISAYIVKPVRKLDLFQTLLAALRPSRKQEAETDTRSLSTQPLKAHVLVAEDNPVNQWVIQYMLQSLGCTVHVVDNGNKVIQAVADKEYDLVLMDCMMPDTDGYAATSEIRRRQNSGQIKKIPIIALTANAIQGDREKCIAAGMDDYLAKPLTKNDLYRVITQWLEPESQKPESKPSPRPAGTNLRHSGIDRDSFVKIRELDPVHSEEFLNNIIISFQESANIQMDTLEKAIIAGNVDTIFAACRAFESSCRQIGALGLAHLCKEMENKAPMGRMEQEYCLSALKHELAAVIHDLSSQQTEGKDLAQL